MYRLRRRKALVMDTPGSKLSLVAFAQQIDVGNGSLRLPGQHPQYMNVVSSQPLNGPGIKELGSMNEAGLHTAIRRLDGFQY